MGWHRKNHEDYKKAISNFWTPAQNIVFAATNGDVALRVQGRFLSKTINKAALYKMADK